MRRLLLVLVLTLAGCAPAAPVQLSYADRGSGPVVVLLHGHPQTSASWRAVVPGLAKRHRVLVVDVRGQGDSPAPEDGYDAATRAADVAFLLRRLDVRSVSVVGADLGAHVAYALARDEPGLVSRLVVLEAVLPGTRAAAGPLSAPHVARHADVDAMVERTRGRELEHVREFVCRDRDPCTHPPELLQAKADALRRPGYLRGAFAPYEELGDPPDDAARIDVPVLAVGGERGIGSLPAQSMREVADEVTEVVLPGATHWLAEEHPQQLLEVLVPFLRR